MRPVVVETPSTIDSTDASSTLWTRARTRRWCHSCECACDDAVVIELTSGRATVRVDPNCGGRISQLVVDGVDLVVTGDRQHDDPLDWGLYPMVPFAGRLRDGVLEWDGSTYDFPRLRPPHALHGTVHDASWFVDHEGTTSCTLSTPLANPWPFPGRVTHELDLHPDRLELRLTLLADVDMPVQIGWHPWFRKPDSIDFSPGAVHRRDPDGIAEFRSEPCERLSWGDLDDCFSDVDENLMITIGGREVRLRSSCRHWVVYDRPAHATCVEPQSGPPNSLNVDPTIVTAGSTIAEWFTMSWAD